MSSDKRTSSARFAELRKRAQIYLSAPPDNVQSLSQEDVKKLVYELDTYQIELELQNEDLNQAHEELNSSRKRYSDLYDYAPAGYLTISEKGVICEANLTAADMLGVARSHLLKQPLSSFIIEEDQDIHYCCRKKLLDTKKPQTCNFRMRKKNGVVFHAQLKSVVDPDLDDSVGHFRTIITDISKEKQLEHALLKSKEEWEKTFDAMSDIVTLMDKNFLIVMANKAAHKFFKVKPGGLNNQHCYELFRGDSTPCRECPLTKTLLDNNCHCTATIEHKNLDKKFDVSSSPIFNENGELQYLVYIAKDITKIIKLEEELFQSHKMEAMGTLAGGIAHDFNNILAAMIGYTELIKDGIPDSSPLKYFVDQVLNSGDRATKLVQQILAFSRTNQGQKVEPLQPHLILKEVLKMMRATLPTTIELQTDIDPNCATVFADPTQLHQIILNLCTNAFHSIEKERGIISFHLSNKTLDSKDVSGEPNQSPGIYVELVVRDSGCGMDKTVMDRMFEPYFTTKGVGKGSGIGLAVVHGIVKSNGGMIKVESEKGKGSTFRVYLPATEKQELVEREEENEILPLGTERILVVDDEDILVQYLTACLSHLNYAVTQHTSSLEALKDFKSRPNEFDLVITDQTMPGMPGSELSQELLKVRPNIPIILCTGYSSMISEEKAKQLGIKRFAIKPVARRDLSKIVREVLDEQKL